MPIRNNVLSSKPEYQR